MGASFLHVLLQSIFWLFHHLTRVGPKQLCTSAHLGCPHAVGGYLLVSPILLPLDFM